MRVFLVNVGANTAHKKSVKSPRFRDGSFEFISFPTEGDPRSVPYPERLRPFLAPETRGSRTHFDPDWENLTYGDNCDNARAAALRNVRVGDLLLFWGLLWENSGNSWQTFSPIHSWYILGALHIETIYGGGTLRKNIREAHFRRASESVHFVGDRLPYSDVLFLGEPGKSFKARRAVSLEVDQADGLFYKSFTNAAGGHFQFPEPKWGSYLRTCRCMWDLERPGDRDRFRYIRDAFVRTGALQADGREVSFNFD